MPFVIYRPSQSSPTGSPLPLQDISIRLTTTPTQVPIFLVPGILGNKQEMYHLARQIYLQSKGIRPIYIYDEPKLSDKLKSEPNIDLQKQVEQIVANITACLNHDMLPYVLAGYSYGATLTALAAKQLKSQGQEVHLFLLDGASPTVVQKFYQNKDAGSIPTAEVIKIAKYAAQISTLRDVAIDEHLKNQLEFLCVESQLDHLRHAIIAEQDEDTDEALIENFNRLIDIAKANLQRLITFHQDETDNIKVKLDSVSLFTTQESEEKYGNRQLGWDNHFNGVKMLSAKSVELDVKDKQHTDILREDSATLIAHSIIENVAESIPKMKILNQQMSYLLKAAAMKDDEPTPGQTLLSSNSMFGQRAKGAGTRSADQATKSLIDEPASPSFH